MNKLLAALKGMLAGKSKGDAPEGAANQQTSDALLEGLVSAKDKADYQVSSATRLFLWVLVVFTVSMLVWAWLGTLDIVSEAGGVVAPSGRVKHIQHLEGGIVERILVREGDSVKPDQPLLVLESVANDSTVEELEVRIRSLEVDVARLKAEADGSKDVAYPEKLQQESSELVEQSRLLFAQHARVKQSEEKTRQEQIRQREDEIREISVRLKNNRKKLELLKEQVALSEDLLKDQLTTRERHLAYLKEQTVLVSDIEEDKVQLSRARSRLTEARERLHSVGLAFREQAAISLKEARQHLKELNKRFAKFKDSQSRTVIRSPVAGLVKSLAVVTEGGVIKAGETIMEIVPADDKLIVEAHLPIADVGYVDVGQEAFIQLASRDASRFGQIDGKVVHVSPDSFVSTDGRAFYRVRIETVDNSFRNEDMSYQLYPGIQVVAYIRTGTRTILEYILDPFFSSMGMALHER